SADLAEFPQIELPQAIRIAIRCGIPRTRQTRQLEPMAITTMLAIPTTNTGPRVAIGVTLTDAPSRTIANSRTNFALKLMPGIQRVLGFHAVRIAAPRRIASTSASR